MTNEVEELRTRTERAITSARIEVKERKAIHKLCDALAAIHERIARLEDAAPTAS